MKKKSVKQAQRALLTQVQRTVAALAKLRQKIIQEEQKLEQKAADLAEALDFEGD